MAMSREASGGGRQVIDALCVGALALLLALSASAIAGIGAGVSGLGSGDHAAHGAADCETAVKPEPKPEGTVAANNPAAGLAAMAAVAPCGDSVTPAGGAASGSAAPGTSQPSTAGQPASPGPAPAAPAPHP